MIRIQGYQTGPLIASGGTADVYEGIQEKDGSKVAIKVLNERFSKDPSIKQRLLREAKILSQLHHRNVVEILQFGSTSERLYMVMEYLGGGSLSDFESLSPRFCLKTMIQICDGIGFIHNLGIIHRDLKPSNILFGNDELPRIVDFGISLFTNEDFTRLTHTHLVMGTLAYMSPEQQIRPQSVNHLTDIYSFGVILYEIFVGRKPVGRFANPSVVRPGFPIELEACILKCLEEDPNARYGSIKGLQTDLIKIWEGGLFEDGHPQEAVGSFDERLGIWIHQWKHGTSREKLLAKVSILENVENKDVPKLMDLIRNGNDNLRLGLIPALGKLASPESVELFLEHLWNPLFTRDICQALQDIGDSRALSALIRLAKKNNAFSDAALIPIGHLGDERQIKVILPFLKSKSSTERRAAILALSSPKSRRYLKHMQKAMKTETDVDNRNLLYTLIQKLEQI